MAGIFRSGQLVQLVDWYGLNAELRNVPYVWSAQDMSDTPLPERTIGILKPGDVAIIVAVGATDGRTIYVLGPNGGGWISGGLLDIVKEPDV